MKEKIIIWGASGHAKVVSDIVRTAGNYEIIGFIDDVRPDRKAMEFCGSYVLGGREQLNEVYNCGTRHLIFGFGNCKARIDMASLVLEKGFSLAIAIHPKAIVANDIFVGAGTVIVGGAVVNPGCNIGSNVIINTSSSVDHDCLIDDGAHIAPGVRMAGNVHIGRGTWIGIGTIIKDGVKIGKNTIIGAGSVVLDDIPDNVVAYGLPAHIIRSNTHE